MSNVQEMALQNELSKASSPVGVYSLPCGYIDAEGTIHKEIELNEMTMKDMDLMASRNVPGDRKLELLLGRCLKRVGNITDGPTLLNLPAQMATGDRVFMLLMLRQISVGDDYPLKAQCPECRKKSTYNIGMSTLEIQQMAEPEKRLYSIQTPSGKMVTFKILTGMDEAAAAKIDTESLFSKSLLARITDIDGVPPTLADVKEMSARDVNFLMTEFDKADGGVNTTLELECPHCGAEYDEELDPSQPGFFFPSRVKKK